MVVKSALTTTGKWVLYLLLALLALIALLAASVRLAVFYGEDYNEKLASLVSSYVGSPVEIGEVELVWNRFDASASLRDIAIQSVDGTETILELPKIELQLNVRDMLLERNLSVRSVQLNNLSLLASYEGSGQLKMLGAGLSEQALNTNDATDANDSETKTDLTSKRGASVLGWLFNAERISILDSDITLIDSIRDREYKVDNINIRVFNDGDLHQVRVSSALPGEIGANSLASFDFTGKADDIGDWNGQFYVNTKGLNLEQLSVLWRKPSQQFSGITDLQLWGKWSGTRVNKVRAIMSGRDIEVTQPSASGSYNTSLSASNINVDLDWLRTKPGWQVNFSRLSAVLDKSDVRLDGLDMHVERANDGKRFRVSGPDIDLQSLQPLYSFVDAMLPIDAPYRTNALRRGVIKDWLLGGKQVAGKTVLTELVAETSDLTIDPYAKVPGIGALSAVVNYRNGVGELTIDNQDINLSMPELYEQPLPVINVDGALQFLVPQNVTGIEGGSPDWKVVTEDLRLSSLDLNAAATMDFTVTPDGQKLIDLHANILNINLSNLKDYYPRRVMKPKMHAWLRDAVVAGDVVRGKVELKGDLNNFAPSQGVGHFYAEADMVNTALKFRPDWPAVEQMDGNLSISAMAMRGRVYQGRFREAQFSDARLSIEDFKSPVLGLQTNAIGPLADMLDFIQTGPLAAKLGPAFGDSTGQGTSRVAMDVQVPLKKGIGKELVVDGEILLENAQIQARKFGIDLDSASGKVRFNRGGVLIDDLLVRYQGKPLQVTATQKTVAGKLRNRVSMNGPMAVSSVMKSYGMPLAEQFSGVSDWQINIDVTRPAIGKKARVEFTAESDLDGTAFKLPVPLDKSADNLHEARIYRDFAKVEQDWWIELPGLIRTRVRMGDDRKVESMAIALGKSDNNVLPWRGIALHGDAQRIDALGWLKLAMAYQKNNPAKSDKGFPLFAKINAKHMLIGNKSLQDLVYIAYRDGTHQVHRLENQLVSGEVMLRRNPASDEPLVMRLDRLDKRLLDAVADAESAAQMGMTNPSYDPTEIPALDISVKELIWNNWRLAKVSMRTQPSEQGMQINALTAKHAGMRVSGNGHWDIYKAANGGSDSHLTSLELNASFDDFGQTIAEVGGGRSFAEGQGEAGLSLTWPTAGYAPNLAQITGQLLFNLRDGRILTVEPGAGRILGLFALQALPRRLTLDFRDITKTGLEYTTLGGNLSIANGLAHTNAIAVSGPVAEILIQGDTDFIAQTYDQTIHVLPRISGALPLLGVISGGPAAGLTALLADGFLRGIGVNLDEIGRRRFLLTGDWDNPQWRAVNVASPSESY